MLLEEPADGIEDLRNVGADQLELLVSRDWVFGGIIQVHHDRIVERVEGALVLEKTKLRRTQALVDELGFLGAVEQHGGLERRRGVGREERFNGGYW